jgi:hypothetical protein
MKVPSPFRPTAGLARSAARFGIWAGTHAVMFAPVLVSLAERRTAALRRDDRGEALAWAAVTVGAVLIAGAVLLILKGKGSAIANNVCTNADPTTC